jgi:hypothetical protein
MALTDLLTRIDAPLRRMDDNLKNICDDLQGELFCKSGKPRLTISSVEACGNRSVAFARTIYSTSQADETGHVGGNWAMASVRSHLQTMEG